MGINLVMLGAPRGSVVSRLRNSCLIKKYGSGGNLDEVREIMYIVQRNLGKEESRWN